ncbi:hypothetical protein AOQ84DRAFT_441131 [Glonium stellatum]|uniref:Uncharacterized protein n=1 Tax=Glonium stellatum TaxID=574774 RepID=A0A8E2EWP8_9PEZI|nr:hypothetical protein AOQ84DRAFT_441131 [Glonium stellatum]
MGLPNLYLNNATDIKAPLLHALTIRRDPQQQFDTGETLELRKQAPFAYPKLNWEDVYCGANVDDILATNMYPRYQSALSMLLTIFPAASAARYPAAIRSYAGVRPCLKFHRYAHWRKFLVHPPLHSTFDKGRRINQLHDKDTKDGIVSKLPYFIVEGPQKGAWPGILDKITLKMLN